MLCLIIKYLSSAGSDLCSADREDDVNQIWQQTKDQKQDLIRAVNSGQDPFSVVKNQAKNIMGQTNATSLSNLEASRDAFNDLTSNLQKFYDAGGNTSYVSGNFEKMVNRIGQIKDPNLVSLATQIQGNIQAYRHAISGTAYSAQEGKDINSIFPGINKSQTLNAAIASGRNILFDSVIDGTYRSTLGPVYDQFKTSPGTYQGYTLPGAQSGNYQGYQIPNN